MSDSEKLPLPGDYYPKSLPYYEKFVKKLAGFDIYKDALRWLALVVTEDTTKNQK